MGNPARLDRDVPLINDRVLSGGVETEAESKVIIIIIRKERLIVKNIYVSMRISKQTNG